MKNMFGLLRLILMAFFVTTEKSPKSSNILLIGANNNGWHPGKEAFYPVGGETGLEDTHFLCPDALRFSHRCVCPIMCWLAFLGACLIRCISRSKSFQELKIRESFLCPPKYMNFLFDRE
ncbi:hypothetical protein AAC387_Pa01g1749 [Persea americana]